MIRSMNDMRKRRLGETSLSENRITSGKPAASHLAAGLTVLALILCLLAPAACLTARAEDYTGKEGLEVVYDGSKLVPNYTAGEITDTMDIIEPGDSMTVKITLKNASQKDAGFWMNNSVLDTFEESNASAGGGAYTYILSYSGKEEPLYQSGNVGGDDTTAGEGLHEATGALKDMFFLETLKPGQEGVITLYVSLDGETQGNDYQKTLADIEMLFAVEEVTEPGKPSTVVKTGDPHDMIPWAVGAGAAGILLLAGCVLRIRERRKEG